MCTKSIKLHWLLLMDTLMDTFPTVPIPSIGIPFWLHVGGFGMVSRKNASGVRVFNKKWKHYPIIVDFFKTHSRCVQFTTKLKLSSFIHSSDNITIIEALNFTEATGSIVLVVALVDLLNVPIDCFNNRSALLQWKLPCLFKNEYSRLDNQVKKNYLKQNISKKILLLLGLKRKATYCYFSR